MNCQKLEDILTDLARDQIVDAGFREEALQHCEVCTSCAQALADQRELTFALRNLAKTWESVNARPALLQNLMVAQRIQKITPALLPNRRSPYWPAAIAAGLLLFFGMGAMLWRQEPPRPDIASAPIEQPSREVGDGSKQLVEAEKVKEPVAPKLQSSEQGRREWRSSGRRTIARSQKKTAPPVSTYTSTEIATEFLPLGYGSAMSLQDGGQIVRVEVPRSMLIRFGLPVNMDRVRQRVKADLLLGVDGSARAIRFVQ